MVRVPSSNAFGFVCPPHTQLSSNGPENQTMLHALASPLMGYWCGSVGGLRLHTLMYAIILQSPKPLRLPWLWIFKNITSLSARSGTVNRFPICTLPAVRTSAYIILRCDYPSVTCGVYLAAATTTSAAWHSYGGGGGVDGVTHTHRRCCCCCHYWCLRCLFPLIFA